jgi:hypothetical protein
MKFSCFARFGHLRFTSQRSEAETIYESMIRAFGGEEMVADGGERVDETIHARFYSHAMRLATAKRNFDRVRGNMNPAKSVELLSYWEQVYGLTPLPTASDDERRAALDVAQQAAQGCRADVVHTAMQELLGSHLIAVRKIDDTEYYVSPYQWDHISLRPGTWKPATTVAKRRSLNTAVHTIGDNTIDTTYVGGSTDMFVVGDKLVVDPGVLGVQESVDVQSVNGTTLTANFARAHASGTIVSTEPWPTAFTTGRHTLIVTDSTVAQSNSWRTQINAKLRKLMRAVDTWDIVEEYSAGQLGPFKVEEGMIGITPIGTLAT